MNQRPFASGKGQVVTSLYAAWIDPRLQQLPAARYVMADVEDGEQEH